MKSRIYGTALPSSLFKLPWQTYLIFEVSIVGLICISLYRRSGGRYRFCYDYLSSGPRLGRGVKEGSRFLINFPSCKTEKQESTRKGMIIIVVRLGSQLSPHWPRTPLSEASWIQIDGNYKPLEHTRDSLCKSPPRQCHAPTHHSHGRRGNTHRCLISPFTRFKPTKCLRHREEPSF